MNFKPNKKMFSSGTSKPKNSKDTIKKLAKYILRYKWIFLLCIFLTVGSNLFALIGPKLSGNAIDYVKGKNDVDFEKVAFYSLLMALFYIASALLSFILQMIMIRASQRIIMEMRRELFNKISLMPLSFFDKYQTGDILSRMSYDIETINTSLSSDIVTMISSIVTITGSFIMMISISPLLVLVFVVTIPTAIIVARYLTKRNRKYYRIRNMKLGELNGFVEERITGLKTIKAYSQEDNVSLDFDIYNQNACEGTYNAEYYGCITGPTVNFINNISLSLVSVFGSILYFYNKITIGNISAFVLYSRKFSGPINEFANLITEIQSSLSAAERVFALMDEKCEELSDDKKINALELMGDIEAKDICFGYSDDKIILNNVSFRAICGKTIAIVGPTGAGKTTIINLLMKFYNLNSGNIYYSNIDIDDCNLKSLRKSYAMVLQDTWLFTGSIYENILYGSINKTKEDVIQVCKVAKIHNYICSLPDGYDTIISDDGANISKGQKQLLTIARAMLLESKMLILDEATSNVDTKTEQEIQDSMLKLMKNKTCFVIAHRLSTIKNADLILVVKDGDIVEQGTHKSLLEKKGFYSELYLSQFN